jgi:hypothetical protein
MTPTAEELIKKLLHPDEDEEEVEDEESEEEELYALPYCHFGHVARDQGGYLGTGVRVIEGQPFW